MCSNLEKYVLTEMRFRLWEKKGGKQNLAGNSLKMRTMRKCRNSESSRQIHYIDKPIHVIKQQVLEMESDSGLSLAVVP